VILPMGIDIAVRAPHQASLAGERGELLWSGHRFRTTAADLRNLWARLLQGFRAADVTLVMEPTRNAWVPLAAWFRRQGARVVLVSAERSGGLVREIRRGDSVFSSALEDVAQCTSASSQLNRRPGKPWPVPHCATR
jgi:Transposase